MNRIKIYDNPNYNDRYTIVFIDMLENNGLYAAIGANNYPLHPCGFYQHTDCAIGAHLGNRITFSSLPSALKKLIIKE